MQEVIILLSALELGEDCESYPKESHESAQNDGHYADGFEGARHFGVAWSEIDGRSCQPVAEPAMVRGERQPEGEACKTKEKWDRKHVEQPSFQPRRNLVPPTTFVSAEGLEPSKLAPPCL
ncbi:hypothetical protein ACFUAC_17335 [Streptomyces sp. NPDC057148]|uniref:hypothetical protein n=1 Tax=unclassified Streptomyces TaxID=2593676 RepID=UPI003634647B